MALGAVALLGDSLRYSGMHLIVSKPSEDQGSGLRSSLTRSLTFTRIVRLHGVEPGARLVHPAHDKQPAVQRAHAVVLALRVHRRRQRAPAVAARAVHLGMGFWPKLLARVFSRLGLYVHLV